MKKKMEEQWLKFIIVFLIVSLFFGFILVFGSFIFDSVSSKDYSNEDISDIIYDSCAIGCMKMLIVLDVSNDEVTEATKQCFLGCVELGIKVGN